MLDEQRNELENRQSKYISIGISEGGTYCVGGIPVPWETTANAFNMKIPDVFIAPEDLGDRALMEKITSFTVLGCYIFTRLDDYGFIAGFTKVRDIYILDGVNVRDLSFLSSLKDWHLLHIKSAHLKDLSPVYEASLLARWVPGICLSFTDCTVDDISALYSVELIDELIIAGKDDDNERERWRTVPALTYMYYTLRPR